jgi:hypothetical protein
VAYSKKIRSGDVEAAEGQGSAAARLSDPPIASGENTSRIGTAETGAAISAD